MKVKEQEGNLKYSGNWVTGVLDKYKLKCDFNI